MYLDDGLCTVTGEKAAVQASQLVKSTIEKAEFVAHPPKISLGTHPANSVAWVYC